MTDYRSLEASDFSRVRVHFLAFKYDYPNQLESGASAESIFYDSNGGSRYCLRGKLDENLIAGIENVILKNDPKEIDNMVGDMFSVRRVNTVHELSSQGKDKSFSK